MGHMVYPRFLAYSAGGGVLWIGLLAYAGYFFGNLPFVRQNLSVVIIAIVLLSILPAIVEYIRNRRATRA
jgi:membrane-associated protein